jgi:hypothetical protein
LIYHHKKSVDVKLVDLALGYAFNCLIACACRHNKPRRSGSAGPLARWNICCDQVFEIVVLVIATASLPLLNPILPLHFHGHPQLIASCLAFSIKTKKGIPQPLKHETAFLADFERMYAAKSSPQ